jgi:hypothetical protein
MISSCGLFLRILFMETVHHNSRTEEEVLAVVIGISEDTMA